MTPRDRPELTQIRHDRKQIEARLMGATEDDEEGKEEANG